MGDRFDPIMPPKLAKPESVVADVTLKYKTCLFDMSINNFIDMVEQL